MNYLAHAYLSFNQPKILVGNMISDHVKGKTKFDYSLEIQKGIQLHRAIDEFTDKHPVTHLAKEFFKPAYRLYAGAFIDILYDYFLANDVNEFPNRESLKDFSASVYKILQNHIIELPERFQQMLPYMQKQNWLYNYQFKDGLQKSFGGLVYRSAYLTESAIAFEIFNKNEVELKSYYQSFFSELKQFSFTLYKQLIT